VELVRLWESKIPTAELLDELEAIKFDQRKMRQHLISCFEKNDLVEPFPKHGGRILPSKVQAERVEHSVVVK
jgi:hypothetical protein